MGTLAGFRDYFMLTALKLSLEKHIYVLTLVPYLVTSAKLCYPGYFLQVAGKAGMVRFCFKP